MKRRKWLKRTALGLGLGTLLMTQSCARFLSAQGGGPLTREELGDWAGMAPRPAPDAWEMAHKIGELKQIKLPSFSPFGGEYAYTQGPHWLSTAIPDPWDFPFVPVPGYLVKGAFPLWRRAIPCTRQGHFVYYNPWRPASREFYASERQWGCGLFIGDFIWSRERVDAYEVSSRERVASQTMDCFLGWGVGWSRLRRVVPVAADGTRGLHALTDPRAGLSDVRYDVRDGSIVLMGLIGWGRVNHRRYVQILWTPIPVSTVSSAPSPMAEDPH